MAGANTLLFRIDTLDAAKGGYPLALYVDAGDAAWLAKPATDPVVIPEGVPDLTGKGWTPKDVREKLAAQGIGPATLEPIGAYLFAVLSQGEVGVRWAKERIESPQARTILDIRPKLLRDLPWELLFEEAERRFLFTVATAPIYRLATSVHAITNPEPLPLRVLAVVGAQANDAKLAWRDEIEKLRAVCRDERDRVILEVLERPTREELAKWLKHFRPDAFHFIGHGMRDGAEPALEFSGAGASRSWRVRDIMDDLVYAEAAPRLAFINACRSGDSDSLETSYDIADAFIRRGTCCAITMQGDIQGAAAAGFAEAVYREILSGGKTLDRAVAAARMELSIANGRDVRDWALPILQMTCTPGAAVPSDFGVAGEARTEIGRLFPEPRDLVDRSDERRDVWWKIVYDDTPRRWLAVIAGPKDIGKTAIVQWCVKRCNLRGYQARYVDLGKEESKDFIRFLSLIRNSEPRTSDDIFSEFDARLRTTTDKITEELFADCLLGLKRLATQKPLILVIDHVHVGESKGGIIPKDFWDRIKPRFLDPIAEGKTIPDLVVLLVVRDPETLDYGKPITVKGWPAKEYDTLVREYFRKELEQSQRVTQTVIGLYREVAGESPEWSPGLFEKVQDAIGYMVRQVGQR